jgi:hypothetical protein
LIGVAVGIAVVNFADRTAICETKAFVAVVPFYGDVVRIRCRDSAKVGRVAVEGNTVANFELFGLVGGHSLCATRGII